MRLLIQRVCKASITVDNNVVGEIKEGLLVFLGIHLDDTDANIDYLIKKIINLRIFNDSEGKMNLSIQDIKGEVLLVSQFTLYADCRKGNRPDFANAAKPEKALFLYNMFLSKIKNTNLHIETGIFGASMKIAFINDGPVTILLEK